MSDNPGEPAAPDAGGEKTPENQKAGQPDAQEVQTLIGQKKHFQEKSEKLEKELYDTQQKLAAQSPTPSRSLDAREFAKLLNQGYADTDIEFVETVMKSTNKPANEVLEMPHVKKALEATKAERQSAQATPAPSGPVSFGGIGRSGAVPPSSFNKGVPSSEIPAEKKLSFQEWKAKRAGK